MTLQEYLYEDYIKTNILPNIQINEDEDNKEENENVIHKIYKYILNELPQDNSFVKSVKSFVYKKAYYNTFKDENGKYDPEKDIIRQWVIKKLGSDNRKSHIEAFYDAIVDLGIQCDCFKYVKNLIKNQNSNKKEAFFNCNFTKGFSLNDIKNYYKNIPVEFWDKLFNKIAGGQPEVGAGEFILKTIAIVDPNKKTGDVQIFDEDKSKSVEVKNCTQHEANLGNNEFGHSKFIFSIFNVDEKKYKTLSISTKNSEAYKQIRNKIKDINNSNDELNKFKELIKSEIISSYLKDSKTNDKIDVTIIDDFIKYLKEIDINNDNPTQFIKICTVFYMLLYGFYGKFDSLCVVDKNMKFNFIDITTFDNLMKNELINKLLYQIRWGGSKSFVQIKFNNK